MRLILNRELGLWCNVYSGKLGEVHTHTHWCGDIMYEVNLHQQVTQITARTGGVMLRLNPYQHVRAFNVHQYTHSRTHLYSCQKHGIVGINLVFTIANKKLLCTKLKLWRVCVCVLSHEDITKHHTHKIRSQQVSTMTVLCFCSHTRMKANRQYESAQCLSEMFYLCVVHLYEFMCGNDSDECVRLKVQEWGHATVFKNWTSHIHLPFGVFSLLTQQSPHFMVGTFQGICRPYHNHYLATSFE